MPVTIRTTDMKYKDSQGNYVGINGVAERTTAEMIADVEAAGADTIADVQQAIAASQAALDGIDAQRNTMIAAIASVAGQGTDTTFTQSGVAADAAAVGTLKGEIHFVDNALFDDIEQAPTSTSTGWRLNESDGLCSKNSSYNLVKYTVTEGERLKIVSDDRFQFQSSSSVPSSGQHNRIGNTYQTGNIYVIVPNGATYLIISTYSENSSAVVYRQKNKVAEIRANVDCAVPYPEVPYATYGNDWSGLVNGKQVTKNRNMFTFDTYNSGGYRYFSMLSDELYSSSDNSTTTISEDAFTLQNRLEKHATYELTVISSSVVAGCGYIGVYDKQGNKLSDILTPSTANTIYKTTFVNDDAPKAILAQRSGLAQQSVASISLFLRKIDPEWVCGETIQKRIRAGRWLHAEGSPVSFVHFSDLHGDGRELGRILAFCNKNGDIINDIIATGDMFRASVESDFTFWSDRNASVSKVLMALGNHEYYTSGNDHTKYTIDTVIQKWIGDYASNWSVIRPSGASYYYKDYAESVRLIVLDCNLQASEGGTDQKTWLAGVLADALTNELAVVIATHYVYLGASKTYDVISGNFTDSFITEDFESVYDWSPTGYADTVQTFINNGGTFVCWLSGHRHKDILVTPTDYPNQLIVMICQASPNRTYPSTLTTGDLERTTDTATADAFNYVTIDTVNSCLKIARVGADLNTFMIPRETVCYNYSTHQVIS